MYRAISSLYADPKSRVILEDNCTDYFDCPVGVKQGDCLSPTLFSIYVNDLAIMIKDSGKGIKIETEDISGISEILLVNILLYADDIVLLADNEQDMQDLLNIVELWCKRWRLEVNLGKTNILHVRAKRKLQSRFVFLFNKRPVPYCTFYKYLGCYVNEHLDYSFTSSKQADSAGRALSSIITKMIKCKGFPFSVYTKLYESCVCSVSQYGSEVFGYDRFDSGSKLQLRALRAYLGLPRNVTSCGLQSEFNWLLPHLQTRIHMVQFLGRILSTSSTRLIFRIYKWDLKLNETGVIKSWSSEVKSIMEEHNLGAVFEAQVIFPVKPVVTELRKSMLSKQQLALKDECISKPKLRTFIQFKEFDKISPHIVKPLTFVERRALSKFRLGILPLRIESARYLRPLVPETERVCYCNSGKIETEFHALFECKMYDSMRTAWLNKICKPNDFSLLSNDDKLKIALNHPANVKFTSRFIVNFMDYRNLVNTKY